MNEMRRIGGGVTMLSMKKLIQIILLASFFLSGWANSFNVFNKSFSSWNECIEYANKSTNDQRLIALIRFYGCNNLYEYGNSISLPDGKKVEVLVGNRSLIETIKLLIQQYPNSFNQSLTLIQMPNGTKVNVPKGINSSEVWLDIAKNQPEYFSLINTRWVSDKENGNFGSCLINNIKTAITEKDKQNLMLKCGDKANFSRSRTLYFVDLFSPDKRIQSTLDEIKNNQRSNSMPSEINCISIGNIIRCN